MDYLPYALTYTYDLDSGEITQYSLSSNYTDTIITDCSKKFEIKYEVVIDSPLNDYLTFDATTGTFTL